MIAISHQTLSEDLSRSLSALQNEIDALPEYSARVAFAKDRWKSKPSAVFRQIKQQLASMCNGNRRCAYCEDSWADEIEHIRPKDLYPDQAFRWANYVLACGPCNGPKNNQFGVLRPPANALFEINRKPKDPVVPPVAGTYALIDPRVEDPVPLLWLDFLSGRYVPNAEDKNSAQWIRAEYTIKVLRLNDRDDLVRGRRAAYSGFESRLKMWGQDAAQWDAGQRRKFVEDFQAERYQGVWERMKRYRKEASSLKVISELIDAIPESLDW